MTLNLYTNNSPKIKADKDLTLIFSLTGDPVEENSVQNPRMLVELTEYSAADYAYIPEYGRYYFIDDKIWVEGNLWRLVMHVDVRTSFKSQIRNNKALLARAQGYFDLYLEDKMLPLEQSSFTTTYALGSSFAKSGVYMLASDSTPVSVS